MVRKGDSLVSYVPVIADSRDQAESGKSGRVLRDLSSFNYMTTAAKRTQHWENKLTMQSKFYKIVYNDIREDTLSIGTSLKPFKRIDFINVTFILISISLVLGLL
jgi:hypothetical protein